MDQSRRSIQDVCTQEELVKLRENGKVMDKLKGTEQEPHFEPVIKLFMPVGSSTWLISELVPEEEDQLAFGVADLGIGFPELGYIWLPEVLNVQGHFGLFVEKERCFSAKRTVSQYADLARAERSLSAVC